MATDADEDFEVALNDEDFEDVAEDEEEGETSSIPHPSRLVAVRRAIEMRMESKRMQADLDYLELDYDDEE